MSALANPVPMSNPDHSYDADAFVFSANLTQPTPRSIVEQGLVTLPDTGGYRYLPADPFQLDGIASYSGGYSQVAGHPNSDGTGAVTLATAVVASVNVLDVLTVDRVVGQITTQHPNGSNVPAVSFLGTRFDNLQIAGKPIEIGLNLDVLGALPAAGQSYFPAGQRQNTMTVSLVTSVSGVPGNMIDIPIFGKIFFGELTLTREPMQTGPKLEMAGSANAQDYKYRFTLTMIRAELNGSASGVVVFAQPDPNGGGHPSPPPLPPERKPKPKV
jgi:hypothetical protein